MSINMQIKASYMNIWFKNIKEIQLLKKKLYKYKWANKPTHAR